MAAYNTIELDGVSVESWQEAIHDALTEATKTIRRVTKVDVLSASCKVADNQITEYRATVRLYFEIESGRH